jgi:hypothetical protein
MVQSFIGTITSVIFIACVRKQIPSRSIEMPSTTMRGPHAVRGPRGLIAGIVCSIPIIRK